MIQARALLPFLFATLASAAQAAPAPDANLLVDHDITEITADGVTRKLHFQERIYRRANLVWVERVLPNGAHDEAEHASGGHSHKHIDLAAAARWVTRNANNSLDVRLVNKHDRVTINVPPAEYGNIGFDGNWANAWHLLDPKQIQTMQAIPGKGTAERPQYQIKTGETTVRVEWDKTAAFPRRVESSNASGTRHKRMVVTDIKPPSQLPWKNTDGFIQKEYSDYLD